MATNKISVNFSRYSDAELIQKTQFIITSTTGNSNYSSPTPSLALVTTANNNFSAACVKAQMGSTNDTLAKNQKRAILVELLHQLGYFVQLNGKNDSLILASSGFDLQKSKSPIGELPKPKKVVLTPSALSMKVSVEAIKGAISYNFLYTQAPVNNDSFWNTISSSSRNTIITGLTSGKQYTFKICGVGSDPSRVYSDEVSAYVI